MINFTSNYNLSNYSFSQISHVALNSPLFIPIPLFQSQRSTSHLCLKISINIYLQLVSANNFNIMRQDYNAIKQKNKFFRKPIQVPQSSLEQHHNTSSFQDLTQSRVQTQFKTFQLPKENIIQVVSILEWRCQTSLPIIKVAEYIVEPETDIFSQKTTFRSQLPINMKSNKLPKTNKLSQTIRQFVEFNPEVSNYVLKVRHQEIKHHLKNIGHLPFSQALQLLKQMLIGFQALYDCFRSFQVTEDLIAINSNDQWCMWIDKDYCNNMKTQCNITEKELIYKLIAITEKHSLQTIQSRHFFGAAKESTFSNDCSFIRMLEKLNEFITVNKMYLVNKVTLPKASDGARNQGYSFAKNALRRFVTNNQAEINERIKRRKQSVQTIYFHSKSATNLFKPIVHNQPPMISYPSCAQIVGDRYRKNTLAQGKAPISMNYLSHVFMPLQEITGSDRKDNEDSSLSIKVNTSPKKKHEQPNKNFNLTQTKLNKTNEAKNTTYSNNNLPNQVFYLSRPKYFKKNETVALQKPVSQLNQPAKRANIRKYSEQLIKLKSVDRLNKRFQNSTICQKEDGSNIEQAEVSRPQPSHIKERQASSSSQDLILSSPNNSSSTKQIRNSGQMDNDGQRSPYTSMKMKDLAPHRKNNQSSINNYNLNEQREKNMSASYQMMRIDGRSDSQSEQSTRHRQLQQPQWVNKISDLFSDTKSIKQLKGSIRMKTFDDEYFQKDHLKDVKLDMLDKFGRSVTLHGEQQSEHHPKQTPKHNQYKSMQLIQQQMDEVKSYQEQQRRDDITVKSIRSRRQTQGYGDKEREISFKDEFIVQQNQSGFNFQTEHYNIRARKGS